jgi:glucose-6-phosphate 1-epimerase
MSELDRVSVRSADGASAEVYLQGAHVSSWRPAPGDHERLFLSARSEFREGVAIRGGIPVIFPQFAAEGPLPKHGFARTAAWRLASSQQDPDGSAVASFTLSDTALTRAIWPASFLATLIVRLGGLRLSVELSIENTSGETFAFTAALHTYLRVHDVSEAELIGLRGMRYRVSGAQGGLKTDEGESIRVVGEIDRVYVDAPPRLTLREPTGALVIEMAGFRDVVVWNPGPVRAVEIKDLEPDGYRRMLCVEAASVQVPIALDAGRSWSGSQSLIEQSYMG